MRAWSRDFPHAYKTISLHPVSDEASYIFTTNPVGHRPYTARILAQPVGSGRAPENWGRVGAIIYLVAIKLIYLAVGAVVGDVYCASNAKIANSGFWEFKQLRHLLGFNTPDREPENLRRA